MFGYEKVTSGASSDIKMATLLARAMVTQYGMSDKLGPLAYGDNEEEVFLGHSIARTQNLSDETQTIVDEEIHRLVDECYEHGAQDHRRAYRRSAHDRARAARIRDAVRRRDQGPAQGQAAGARIRGRYLAAPGAGLGRSHRRPRQEGAARARARHWRHGASAHELRSFRALIP